MGVFGKSTKVSRAVADPGTDDTLPSPGALTWGGITAASGVAGTTGADAKLVKGDRWQAISGTQTETIDVDFKSTITGNQTHMVGGNENIQITGNATRQIISNLTTTVIGAEIRSNIGAQNYSHVGTKARVHAGDEGHFEPGEFFRYVQEHSEAFFYKAEATGINCEAKGVDLCVCATKAEGTVYAMDVTLYKTETKAVDIKIKALENKVKALHNKISAARVWLGGAAANLVTSQLFLTLLGINQIF
jgi:hypothetical protein